MITDEDVGRIAREFAADKLKRMRDLADLRDAMSKAREYVGGEK